MKGRFIITFLIYAFALSASELQFKHLTTEDGLNSNFYSSSYIDHYGYLWIGTMGGLDRYDGDEIRNFNTLFTGRNKKISNFAEDKNGNLLIGTLSGLFRWDRVTPKFEPLVFSGIESDPFSIFRIVPYKQDLFYININHKLYLFNIVTKEIKLVQLHEDITNPLNYIVDFILDNQSIYAITQGGLIEYHLSNTITNKKYQILSNEKTVLDAYCFTLYRNKFYIGSSIRGLYQYSLPDSSLSEIQSFSEYKVRCIAGYENQLFVGTMVSGLKIYDTNDHAVFSYTHNKDNQSTLSSNSIQSISIDKNKQLWVNSYGNGLNYTSLSKQVFKTYNKHELVNSSIRSLYFEPSYKLIGTRDGLFMVDSLENIHKIDHEQKWLNGQVIINFCKYKEDVLVSVLNAGIKRYSPKTNKISLWLNDYFFEHSAYSFDKDTMGNLWIGTHNGLYRVSDKEKVTPFLSESSPLKNNCIYAVKIDSENRIWTAGTRGVYIYKSADDSLMFLKKIELATLDKVGYLYRDSSNTMWVCMDKNGLYQFDMNLNMVRHINEDGGVCNNTVVSMLESKKNEFWLGTLNGLTYLNTNIDSTYCINAAPGLPGATFNLGAIAFDSQDNLWMGNERGLVNFKPHEVLKLQLPENIVITDILTDGVGVDKEVIDNKPIETINQLTLGDVNSLKFRFVNLTLTNTSNKQYCTKLEGRDTTWQYTNENQVVYSALNAGKYTFKVGLAGSNKKVVRSSVRSLQIIVNPIWDNGKGIVIFLILAVLIVPLSLFSYLRKSKKEVKFIKSFEEKERYKTSKLDEAASKAILFKVQSYMVESKAYLNKELRISDVSEALNIPTREISQAINENISLHFTSFINEYRVNEVKNRMTQLKYKKYTIQAIAESCGFKTKTSFNMAFRKVTGQTPSSYRSDK